MGWMIRGLNPDKRRTFPVLQKIADRLSVPPMDTAIVSRKQSGRGQLVNHSYPSSADDKHEWNIFRLPTRASLE